MALRISRSRAVFSSLALRSASSASLDPRSALSIFSLSTLRRFKSASFLVRGPKSADLKKCSEQIKFGFASFVVDRRGRILASVSCVKNREPEMAQLHARGVELVVDLLDAADHLEGLTPEDIRSLLRETASALADLLERDVPKERRSTP